MNRGLRLPETTMADDTHEVEFVEADGTTVTATVGADESILDAARRTGVDLRWGCTEGQCTSCTSRLLSGDVEWVGDPKAGDGE
jgi:ferredoxin